VRRLLTADPVFFTIVDAESHLLQCSAPTIIRTGTLEFIARSHQTRIPGLFHEEKEIATYQRCLEIIMETSKEAARNPAIIALSKIAGKDLRYALYEASILELEKSRNKLFSRTRPHQPPTFTPV